MLVPIWGFIFNFLKYKIEVTFSPKKVLKKNLNLHYKKIFIQFFFPFFGPKIFKKSSQKNLVVSNLHLGGL
jgi:hypothetical protein